MKATIKREITTYEETEITVPSFWKSKHTYYRVYQDGDQTRVDTISIWDGINELWYKTNAGINSVSFNECTETTKSEWLSALDRVYNKIEEMLNDLNPQGNDSAWILRAELVPTTEPQNN